MNIRESFYLYVKAELDNDLTNEDDSYNYIVDALDTLYRNKEFTDFSLDIWDIKNIMTLLDNDGIDIERAYMKVLEYLED